MFDSNWDEGTKSRYQSADSMSPAGRTRPDFRQQIAKLSPKYSNDSCFLPNKKYTHEGSGPVLVSMTSDRLPLFTLAYRFFLLRSSKSTEIQQSRPRLPFQPLLL